MLRSSMGRKGEGREEGEGGERDEGRERNGEREKKKERGIFLGLWDKQLNIFIRKH